jgi:hypothetical protein
MQKNFFRKIHVFFLVNLLLCSQILPLSIFENLVNVEEAMASSTTGEWVLSSVSDGKTEDPLVNFQIAGNDIEITNNWEGAWPGYRKSKHRLPEMPEKLFPGQDLRLVLTAETGEVHDSCDRYIKGHPDWTNYSEAAETTVVVEIFKGWSINQVELYNFSTAWWYFKDLPIAGEDDVCSFEYEGESVTKEYTWKVWDTTFEDGVSTEVRVYFYCTQEEGSIWFERKYTYILEKKTDLQGVKPYINSVRMTNDELIFEDIQVIDPVLTPDCRGICEFVLGVWVKDAQDTINVTVKETSAKYPFIIKAGKYDRQYLVKEWTESGSLNQFYHVSYIMLVDAGWKYPEGFTLSISLDAYIKTSEGSIVSKYTSSSESLDITLNPPQPMNFSFHTPVEGGNVVNLLQPMYLDLSFSYANLMKDLTPLEYSNQENRVFYEAEIQVKFKPLVTQLHYLKNSDPSINDRKSVKFRIVEYKPSNTVAVADTGFSEKNKVQFEVFPGMEVIQLKIELDNADYKYWPDLYFFEVETKFRILSEPKVLATFSIDNKPVGTTTEEFELPVIQHEVIVQIDPQIREDVRKYLAERWYKRFKELDARTGNTTVNSIDDMYDIIDSKEEFINLYAATLELTLTLHHPVKGTLFDPGEFIDKLEDAVDLGKCIWLFVNGYKAESITDLAFKLGPDFFCDYAVGVVGKTAAITIAPVAGAGVGFSVGGPIGGVIGGILGYFIGSKGAEAIEGVCEIGAAFIENWWGENKEYYIQYLGSETRINLKKWKEKGRPFYDEDDARLWGISKSKSNGLLHVYDSAGRHMGPTTSGEIEAEIPGSVYIYLPEEKTAVFCIGMQSNPVDEYSIEVECTESGHYDLLVTAASQTMVTNIIDVENSVMQKGQVISETADTRDLWDNLDQEPPEIIDVVLSENLVTDIDDSPEIVATVTDDYDVHHVLAVLLKNDSPVTYSTLLDANDGKFTGAIPLTEDLINGEYILVIQAYDHQSNVASKTFMIEVDIDTKGDFQVTDLEISPTQAKLGERVLISAEIVNNGDYSGTYNASLYVNDYLLATKSVEIPAGGSETVSWQTTEEWTAGTYEVKIGDKTETFRIVEEYETTLSIYLHSSVVRSGDSATISGYLSPIMENANIRISLRSGDGSWIDLDDVETDYDGFYYCDWTPTILGTYYVKAALIGEDGLELVSSSTETLLVEEESRCIIATVTYGSELSPEVQFLRNFRDKIVLKTFAGSSFMMLFNRWYYSFSPQVARAIEENNIVQRPLKVLLRPLLGVLRASNLVYEKLSLYPELSVLVTGLVTSTLIAIVYLSLPLAFIQSCFDFRFKLSFLKKTVCFLMLNLSIMFLAELWKWGMVMSISTVNIVISAMIVSSILVVRLIYEHLMIYSLRKGIKN